MPFCCSLSSRALALREGEHFLGLALPPTEAESQFKRKIELHGFRRIERPALPTEPAPRARVPFTHHAGLALGRAASLKETAQRRRIMEVEDELYRWTYVYAPGARPNMSTAPNMSVAPHPATTSHPTTSHPATSSHPTEEHGHREILRPAAHPQHHHRLRRLWCTSRYGYGLWRCRLRADAAMMTACGAAACGGNIGMLNACVADRRLERPPTWARCAVAMPAEPRPTGTGLWCGGFARLRPAWSPAVVRRLCGGSHHRSRLWR